MKARRRRFVALVVPFLVGGVAAVTVETSAALLLYVGRGLLSALSLVVAVDLVALAVGLWAGGGAGVGAPEALRRRWLGALLAFVAAAVVSAGWMMHRDLRTAGAGRALGLALLAAWPLYALGTLLAELGREGVPGSGPGAGRADVAAAASAGAASGFLVTGTVLIPALAPPSIYLLCVVVLSGGALLYGSWRGGAREGGVESEGEEEAGQEPARKEPAQEVGDA